MIHGHEARKPVPKLRRYKLPTNKDARIKDEISEKGLPKRTIEKLEAERKQNKLTKYFGQEVVKDSQEKAKTVKVTTN